MKTTTLIIRSEKAISENYSVLRASNFYIASNINVVIIKINMLFIWPFKFVNY